MCINFLFLTRTRDNDYRVYKNSGELAEAESEKIFMDNLKISGITGTEEPFNVLSEDDGKFYVLAGGMKTGGKDREGRQVRFSFLCELDEYDEAMKIFLTLASKWEESVNFMRSCLDEKFDRITFSHIEFMNWLKSSKPENTKLNLHSNKTLKSKLFVLKAVLMAVLLITTGILTFYNYNIRAELDNSHEEIASLSAKINELSTTKINELKEIHSALSGAFDLMGNSYRYIDMMSEDAKLAEEYSRREADKAKILLNEAGVKISSFNVKEGVNQ